MNERIAYLGPRGSFAEAALRSMPRSNSAELVPESSVQSALEAARNGLVDLALVPIENSVEGSVSITLDELSAGEPLVIVDEVALPVEFALVARPGTQLTDIRRIATHPHAQAQVRKCLQGNVPDAVVIPALSTAAAAKGLTDSATGYEAAVAQAITADLYGLATLAMNIEDNEDAVTRFVLVRRPGRLPAPTGADKTTLSLYMHQDQPGALLAILNELAVRGINLTRIESRPTKKVLGDYYFSIDFEGHIADERVAEAMMGLHRICLDVRFLGSYPRHDERAPHIKDGVSDQDYEEARDWLSTIRE